MSQNFDDAGPGHDSGSSSGPGGRSPVLIGILVGVLIFVVAGSGFAAWKYVDGRDDDAASTGRSSAAPTPTPSATSTGSSSTPYDPKLSKFYEQKLRWVACEGNECAVMKVPLDYAKPAGKTIDIAVLRVPARDKGGRLGSIVVNPGGPGGSGVDYASAGSLQFGRTLTNAYDIVGFDPRGVGKSTALDCIGTEQLDELVAFDPDPDTQAERDEMDRLLEGFGRGCLENSGELARHVSTVEAARDMDILRAALGEDKLDYLGASYGTFLGATYADLFPKNVDKMVLDGAVDPSLSNEELSLQQAGGFETALRAYVGSCVAEPDCFLGSTVDEGTRTIRAFLDDVEKQPLPTDEDRDLTIGTATIGTWLPLYVKEFWPQLDDALQQAMDEGDGTALLSLADLYLSRGEDAYTDNSMQILYAVNCLDHNDYIPTDQVPSRFDKFLEVSPTYGKAFAFSLATCASWPIKTGNVTEALDAPGAPPIVVIGTTRDPATPLRWAVGLAEQLDSGVLVTRDGDGHTAFQRGNDCIDDAVEQFFTQGKVPADDLKC